MAFDLFTLSKERRTVLKEVYFDRYVDKKGPDDCWEWKYLKNPKGYGSFNKRFGKKVYRWQAHRLAWMFHYDSPIPHGLLTLHSCDQPSCCNPLHLMIGTNKQNVHDSWIKGRRKRNGKVLKLRNNRNTNV